MYYWLHLVGLVGNITILIHNMLGDALVLLRLVEGREGLRHIVYFVLGLHGVQDGYPTMSVEGLKRSGVDPPLTSSHACLHMAFIALCVRH